MGKINDEMFILTNDKYGEGIAVDYYQNEVSLMRAKMNKDTGDIWPEWVFPQRRQDGKNVPGEKALPWKLTLGVREDAIRKMETLLKIIEMGGKGADGGEDNGDLPF